jgi:hypothetical protein
VTPSGDERRRDCFKKLSVGRSRRAAAQPAVSLSAQRVAGAFVAVVAGLSSRWARHEAAPVQAGLARIGRGNGRRREMKVGHNSLLAAAYCATRVFSGQISAGATRPRSPLSGKCLF